MAEAAGKARRPSCGAAGKEGATCLRKGRTLSRLVSGATASCGTSANHHCGLNLSYTCGAGGAHIPARAQAACAI